jgi:hypothetical protein
MCPAERGTVGLIYCRVVAILNMILMGKKIAVKPWDFVGYPTFSQTNSN